MISVHYETDTGCGLVPKENLEKALAIARDMDDGEPVICCEIEGEHWFDCLRKYHEHMGWEPWKPEPGWED
jgi:hypothetical protein